MHSSSKTLRRVAVATATSAALVAGSAVAPGIGSAAPLVSAAQSATIDAALAVTLAQGPSEFWVRFSASADLSAAAATADRTARGKAVYRALTRTADASQADVRAYLDAQGVDYTAFWAVNAIHLESGTAAQANALAAFDGVASVMASEEVEFIAPVTDPVPMPEGTGAVEWGIANINADDVWSQFGDRGKGIVVANIDTGVQYNHPALVKQYRGKKKGGTFNHNYNWYNAYGTSTAPFDNNGHGTHTMGTMVGDDGGANQIGVAPKAKWIASNGCCGSEAGLVASGQWMLAPTKLNGSDPKPGKRPDIVNNSWGYTSPGQQTLFDAIIAAWDAAGIFGQWSNGNIGPGCSTSGAPGSRPQSYSAGAYDISNVIASFSSRGPGQAGDIKPNISAPGVNVRSAWLGSSYNAISGTSMASPHVAGAIALLWAEVPSLQGDIPGTKAALDGTATDTAGACGGTTDDNNTFGEGRLDALQLVSSALARETAAKPTLNTNTAR